MGPTSRKNGFSLLEILVVLALIGLTLFLTVPRFGATLTADPALRTARWVLITVEKLKRSAAFDQQLRTLHIDIAANRLWVTRGEDAPQGAPRVMEGGRDLDSRVRLIDVEYPRRGTVTEEIAGIRFHPQGHSDRAIIHLETDDQRRFSFQIEPFLARAKLFESHKGFEE